MPGVLPDFEFKVVQKLDEVNGVPGPQRLVTLGVFCFFGMGCSLNNGPSHTESASQVPVATTVAVAPALNFSGSADIDLVQVADLMASEFSMIPGVGVIGVNRVLAILAEQGLVQIQSPQHALDICDRAGADAILVFAIIEYDAYCPLVGIAAQLYHVQDAGPMLDPVATSRMARPFPVSEQGDATRPSAQVQRTFNGKHDAVQRLVRCYAESRGAEDSSYGWRKYLASQRLYLRFCCYTMATDLMGQAEPLDAVATAE